MVFIWCLSSFLFISPITWPVYPISRHYINGRSLNIGFFELIFRRPVVDIPWNEDRPCVGLMCTESIQTLGFSISPFHHQRIQPLWRFFLWCSHAASQWTTFLIASMCSDIYGTYNGIYILIYSLTCNLAFLGNETDTRFESVWVMS